ncbi:PTS lactose/cellobiose transporter subunit IIA [Pediococcus acidilactici]|nr:PTS lactose/cellobiose transporter subunit IIA [Pediococcus acidilactici]
MEGLEEICFEIISHSGQAKGLLMEAVTDSRAEHPDYSAI